jgi:SagB-type dehydrogenase family enzyme
VRKKSGKPESELYRRSPYLVCYWQDRQFVLENYAAGKRVAAAPLTCEMLDFFDRWRPAAELARHFPQYTTESLAQALANLINHGLVERSGAPRDEKAEALATWGEWSPAASFFHLSTKDSHQPIEPDDSVRFMQRRARAKPLPPAIKSYPKNRQIALPSPASEGDFPRVLLERRTWRQFSSSSLALGDLATLLGLTFGVQSWLDLRGIGRVALKTSPSGGARHPIEAYVIAQRVQGLSCGLYHYNAADHRLELLHKRVSAERTSNYLNGQWWAGKAAAVVLMTAVFARPQWKYPASRAYRIVLIDAGHLCQTFCLVATWLGLAPFCTMAIADSAIEKDLEIDGVTESILYTAGVGARLGDSDSARWPEKPYGRRIPNDPLSPRR